jgi:hypothetical protein
MVEILGLHGFMKQSLTRKVTMNLLSWMGMATLVQERQEPENYGEQ